MMTDLLINAKTASELSSYLKRPSHALLLAGLEGSGRQTVARMLAAELLGTERLDASANFLLVHPEEKPSITIEQIKALKQFTKLKSPSRRVVIIDPADKMQFAAQNSFLKLLEEPPENVFFMLVAPDGSLRPTIISRLQKIIIRPVGLAEVSDYFSASKEEIKRAYQMSGGKLGVMSQILNAEDNSAGRLADQAKRILTSSPYQRLLLVNELAKDKSEAQNLLEVLGQMATAALAGANDIKTISRWEKVLAANYKAEASLSKNLNAKLVLTDLMLNL